MDLRPTLREKKRKKPPILKIEEGKGKENNWFLGLIKMGEHEEAHTAVLQTLACRYVARRCRGWHCCRYCGCFESGKTCDVGLYTVFVTSAYYKTLAVSYLARTMNRL